MLLIAGPIYAVMSHLPCNKWTEELFSNIVVSLRVLKCKGELVRLGQLVLLHQPVLLARYLNVVVASAVGVHTDTIGLQLFHPLQSLLWATVGNECRDKSSGSLGLVIWIHDGVLCPREVRQREVTECGEQCEGILRLDLRLIAGSATQLEDLRTVFVSRVIVVLNVRADILHRVHELRCAHTALSRAHICVASAEREVTFRRANGPSCATHTRHIAGLVWTTEPALHAYRPHLVVACRVVAGLIVAVESALRSPAFELAHGLVSLGLVFGLRRCWLRRGLGYFGLLDTFWCK